MERSDQGLYLRYLLKDQHTTGPPTPDIAVCCRPVLTTARSSYESRPRSGVCMYLSHCGSCSNTDGGAR